MSDFSIRSASVQNNRENDNGVSDSYSRLRQEYDKKMKQFGKSDLANSPVLIEKELSMIAELKIAAAEQKLDDEITALEERENFLKSKLSASSEIRTNAYYMPVSFKGNPLNRMSNQDENVIDYEQDRFIKFLSQPFDDEDLVKSQLENLYKAGIGLNSAIDILNIIKVLNPEDNTYSISDETVRNLISIKNVLVASSDNEKEEYDNPISRIGQTRIQAGKTTIIYNKDGEIEYISPISFPSAQTRKANYDQFVSKEEDTFLIDFAKKYVDKAGKIDSVYIRTLLSLRQAGVIKGEMISLIDMCISEDGTINKDVINTIKALKKAGVLSADIKTLTESFKVDDSGCFDKNDLENAVKLTKTIMTGKDVAEFLPLMRTGEEATDYILYFSDIFTSEHTNQLANLALNSDSVLSENAMDVVNSLLRNNSIYDEQDSVSSEDFIALASKIMTIAKDFGSSDDVSEHAAEVIFEMNRRSFPLEDIEKLLSKCLDENGKLDASLTKILWHMAWNGNSIPKMHEVLDICHEDKSIISHNAELFLTYLDKET